MYLLALLTVVIGAAVASPLAIPSTQLLSVPAEEEKAATYRLPRDTFPTFYDVILHLNPDNEDYFTGSVDIRIIPLILTNEILLHAMQMEIKAEDIEVFTDRNNTNLYASHTLDSNETDTHFLRITLSQNMTVLQPHTVRIKHYVGQYADNMFGIYVSTYNDGTQQHKLITSQLQPTFARRAFPCYDEPSFKAIFRTTIYAPTSYGVVESNMPKRTDLLKPDPTPGFAKHEFRDTLVMSTYLLAYLVSNLNHIDNQMEGEFKDIYHIPFKVFSRPGTQNTAYFALEFGQKNMVELEKYIKFKYEFPKLDKAAVPDFAAGAMENWGLVIYREVALLVTEGVTTTATKQNVGRIICHENVHQWFGNEVSPLSWTYTWLNEGFANFFENFATDFVHPEWRMMDQFVLALQNVFQSDAVLSVNPMTHGVYTPSEVIGTFNAVAYQKSGSVIRMMQHFLTPDVFQQGLVLYIKNNTRKAVGPSQLYDSLEAALIASNHSIPFRLVDVMSGWVYQGGFPVLTVTRSAPSAQSVVVQQVRYLTDNTLTANDRWHVPINWVLSTNPDFSDTSPQDWVPPSGSARAVDIPGLQNAPWYIFNKQQTGYYRVNYDTQNWAALATALNTSHEVIHLLNRAQLLDDAFNLARNGRLNYEYAFRLSVYLDQEKDYIPWGAVNPAFTYLDTVLYGSPVYELFQKYILHLSAPLYAELGFDVTESEEHVTAYHRNIILELNCRHGNEDCLEKAQQKLDSFRNDDTQRLNPDIQTLIYCSGLRGGSAENFNFLWNMYLASQDSSEQSILLNALGCTSNEERRTFYLNKVIEEDSPVREQDRHTIVVAVTNASPNSTEAALDFVIKHFDTIQKNVQGLTGTTNILNAFARRLTTEAHTQKINEFQQRHQGILSAGELASISGIRENIAASITWSKQNSETVANWLTLNYGPEPSSAHALVSGFILIISVVVTILNY